jgi:hypothetical protein
VRLCGREARGHRMGPSFMLDRWLLPAEEHDHLG